MSLKNVTKNKDNTAVLEFEIPKADFDAAVNGVYRKKASRLSVPGFRKGKAPRAIIEKMYGKGFFYEDALNDLLPGVLDAALTESGLEVVSRPELDITEIGDNGV
ncbi:MAG: trigger factor family protein, partial [Clostridia bacterium]|nr:trigger factor family protein [Clostridia bacterium]